MAKKQRFSAKKDTYTDRNGDVVQNISEKGFTRGTSRGLLASDVSGLIEVREDNALAIVNAIDEALVKD